MYTRALKTQLATAYEARTPAWFKAAQVRDAKLGKLLSDKAASLAKPRS